MAFLNADMISRLAVELLVRSIVLPATVSRVPGTDFSGPSGGSVVIRVPVPRVALEQTVPGDPIIVNPVTEVPVSIAVSHVYDATRVTDEDMSLSIENFGRQVLAGQVAAVATRAEDELATLLAARAPALSFPADPITLDDEEWRRQYEDRLLEAGEILDGNNVPAGGRTLAVSASVARRLLRIDKFTRADARGDGGTALDEATLGRLSGFTVVKATGLAAGEAHAYHRSALAQGFLAPVVGSGVVGGASQSQGVALTTIRQYHATTLAEHSVVHTYVGAAEVDADRIVSLDTAV